MSKETLKSLEEKLERKCDRIYELEEELKFAEIDAVKRLSQAYARNVSDAFKNGKAFGAFEFFAHHQNSLLAKMEDCK